MSPFKNARKSLAVYLGFVFNEVRYQGPIFLFFLDSRRGRVWLIEETFFTSP